MQTWWNNSPYFDYGVYLPGAASSCGTDGLLNAAWVSTVLGQGWGLIPIWSGPQAPCACDPNLSKTQCIPFPHTFSPDPIQANADGLAEVNSAINSATALGLAGAVIYYDMEQYSSACSSAVISFLDGWAGGMHSVGLLAAAYSSASDVAPDFVHVSPALDDVWMSSERILGNPPRPYNDVTVWGINGAGYSLGDTAWKNNQRIRQYRIDHNETWGGGLPVKIDSDIVDATIVQSTGVKSYSFSSPILFKAPGATTGATIGTFPQAINDGVDHTLVSGQKGLVVGYYTDATATDHGFVYNPNSGTFPFPSIDCAGAVQTDLQGINNAGIAVGFWKDSDGGLHAFSYNANVGGACNPLCTTDCLMYGINDANWIVGSTSLQGFVTGNGGFFPFMYPGAMETIAEGINGQGGVTGTYSPDEMNLYGFIADAIGGSITTGASFACPPGGSATIPSGYNSNGQIVGINDGNGGSGFLLNGGACTGLDQGYSYGLNNDVQIVGEAFDEPPRSGFVLVPQQ